MTVTASSSASKKAKICITKGAANQKKVYTQQQQQ